jgi:hypothetical protein
MPSFSINRTMKLDFLGTNWKDCFIVFTSTSIRENNELARMKLQSKSAKQQGELVLQFLRDHFVEGVGFDAETQTVVPIKKEEIDLLPSTIQERMVLFLVGDAGL